MRERTLLFGALTATAIAAGLGVYKAHVEQRSRGLEIAPVSRLDSARVFLARADGPPIRLTASDGTGLRLASIKVSGAIEDPAALTELHLVFENPQDRALEGRFQIALPQGASVSRFAVKGPDGKWIASAVTAREEAEVAYEGAAREGHAPALLEHSAGSELSARVSAIAPRGVTEILITYVQVLEAGTSYVVPLKGLPAAALSIDIDVRATGRGDGATRTFALHQQNPTGLAPQQDFVVEARSLPRSPGLRNGDLVVARVVPFGTSRPDPITSAVVLIDTSASRTLGIAEQANLVRRVFAKLPPDAHVSVACFDQEVAPIYDGTTAGFGESEVAAIVARGALGASDMQRAIAWAGEEAARRSAKRVILVSDGVSTAGETDNQKIKADIEKLRASKVERVDAIAVGGVRDDSFFRSVVRGVLDKDGVVLDADLGADALARRLSEKTTSGLALHVDGAKWSWPRTLDGIQAGDEVMVYAEIADGLPFQVDVAGQSFSPELRPMARPLLERVWAQAKIESLIEAPTLDPVSTRNEIIALGTKHHVLTARTAMVALDTHDASGAQEAPPADLTVKDGRAVFEGDSDRQTAAKSEQKNTKQGGKADGDGIFDLPFFGKKKAVDSSPSPASAPPASSASTITPTPVTPAPAPPPPPDVALAPPATATASPTTTPTFARTPPPAQRPKPSPTAHADPKPAPKGNTKAAEDEETRKALEALQKAQLESSSDSTVTPPPPPKTIAPAPSPRLSQSQSPSPHVRLDTPPPPPPKPAVRLRELTTVRGFTQSEPQRVVRAALPRLHACYKLALSDDDSVSGTLRARIFVNASGAVDRIEPLSTPGMSAMAGDRCSLAVLNSLRLPAPAEREGELLVELSFSTDPAAAETDRVAHGDGDALRTRNGERYAGRFKVVMDLLARKNSEEAFAEAMRWRSDEPTDTMALVALGEAAEAKGDVRTAARAYGSILELHPSSAESRRLAGERLERLHDPAALRLAVDTYRKATLQRPDQASGHRLYAFALLKQGDYAQAFDALRAASARSAADKLSGVERVLRDDLGLVAAAWSRAEPRRASEIHERLRAAGGQDETEPSVRFVLTWESSSAHMALSVLDGRRALAAGDPYGDARSGYGPACFVVRQPRDRRAYPYAVHASYDSLSVTTPLTGYGMGKLEILEHDGKGNLVFEERPFVVAIGAGADLGMVEKNASEESDARRRVIPGKPSAKDVALRQALR